VAQLPQSVVSRSQVLVGLASLIAAILLVARWQPIPQIAVIIILLAAMLPMVVFEAVWKWRPLFSSWRRPSSRRVLIKLVGLFATYALICLGYYIFPLYRVYQRKAVGIMVLFGAFLLALSPIYLWITDGFMDEPEDGLYSAGLAVLGKWPDVGADQLIDYLKGWIIKAFFLPLMLWYCLGSINWLYTISITDFLEPLQTYNLYENLIPLIDVTWGSVGYLCTFRLVGTQIRSTDPALKGWIACLICYLPFSEMLGNYFISYAILVI
jgi:hypothetical protein